jgi:hypothetical protein
MSLDPSFQGDWDTIYSFGEMPVPAAIALVVHLGSLVAFVFLLNRNKRMKALLGT